jgi:hypothetical protein
MPVTLTEICTDDLIPMRGPYERIRVTADDILLAGIGLQETVLVHRTVDHQTRLEAANAMSEEMGLKPSKKLDVNLTASRLLAEVLQEIEGATGGLPGQRKKG